MLFESVLFGLAAGVLLGGSIKEIFRASFRRLPLIFIAAAIDILLSSALGSQIASIGDWALVFASLISGAASSPVRNLKYQHALALANRPWRHHELGRLSCKLGSHADKPADT